MNVLPELILAHVFSINEYLSRLLLLTIRYIEIDPGQCGYSTFLGAAVPAPDVEDEDDGDEENAEG